jgi:hypothetical protein
VVYRVPKPVVIAHEAPEDPNAEAFARHIGNLGNHSRHLGARWERLAAQWVQSLVSDVRLRGDTGYTVHLALNLDSDERLRDELSRLGLSCPDLLLAGRAPRGHTVLEPIDSKVSLDTASFDQVQAVRVLDTLRHGGPSLTNVIQEGLRSVGLLQPGAHNEQTLLAWSESDTLTVVDGTFVAPATGFNRAQVQSAGNKKRRRALTADDVHLIRVTEHAYLRGLPGYDESLFLRALDGLDPDSRVDLSVAERYYRMGAGIVGAILVIQSPLFGDGAPPDTLETVRAIVQANHCSSSLALMEAIRADHTKRRSVLEQRQRLERYPVPFREVAERVSRRTPGRNSSKAALRAAYEQLRDRYRAALHFRGAELLAAGASEGEVLRRLEAEQPPRVATAAHELEALLSRYH